MSPFLNDYFTVVEEDTAQDWFRNSESLCDSLIQALEVQTSLVVAQGLDDKFRDDWGHSETSLAGS